MLSRGTGIGPGGKNCLPALPGKGGGCWRPAFCPSGESRGAEWEQQADRGGSSRRSGGSTCCGSAAADFHCRWGRADFFGGEVSAPLFGIGARDVLVCGCWEGARNAKARLDHIRAPGAHFIVSPQLRRPPRDSIDAVNTISEKGIPNHFDLLLELNQGDQMPFSTDIRLSRQPPLLMSSTKSPSTRPPYE